MCVGLAWLPLPGCGGLRKGEKRDGERGRKKTKKTAAGLVCVTDTKLESAAPRAGELGTKMPENTAQGFIAAWLPLRPARAPLCFRALGGRNPASRRSCASVGSHQRRVSVSPLHISSCGNRASDWYQGLSFPATAISQRSLDRSGSRSPRG